MSFVNHGTKEINCKIVYYGPGLGGKTTNVQRVWRTFSGAEDKRMISLDTENERTLFFDFLPLELGTIRGFAARLHLYTVPGQVFYEASRRLVLRGVDGIVFVADSQVERMEANLESLAGLEANLEEQGASIDALPLVMQWNKRDLPNVASVESLGERLNRWGAPAVPAVASRGEGVVETLKTAARLVLAEVRAGVPPAVGAADPRRARPPSGPPAPGSLP